MCLTCSLYVTSKQGPLVGSLLRWWERAMNQNTLIFAQVFVLTLCTSLWHDNMLQWGRSLTWRSHFCSTRDWQENVQDMLLKAGYAERKSWCPSVSVCLTLADNYLFSGPDTRLLQIWQSVVKICGFAALFGKQHTWYYSGCENTSSGVRGICC